MNILANDIPKEQQCIKRTEERDFSTHLRLTLHHQPIGADVETGFNAQKREELQRVGCSQCVRYILASQSQFATCYMLILH